MELTQQCSGSEAGSYLRLIEFVYHPTLDLRVKKKKKRHTQQFSPKERLKYAAIQMLKEMTCLGSMAYD